MPTTEKKVRILEVSIRDEPGYLGALAQAIGEAGVRIGDIVKLRAVGSANVRELELYIASEAQLELALASVARLEGVRIERVYDPVLEIHRGGKIHMHSTVPVQRIGDVRMIYTPGVATVCDEIQRHPEKVYDYTALGSTVAIVTNGSAVLGLGNVGVHAGLPVMEGKAVLFDRLVGLSGIPILIPTRDIRAFVETVIQIAPSFGAIQLEDIAAPECFEIERRLIDELPIPVMHDDQHGTAVVVLAALLNALADDPRELRSLRVGVLGMGAAGTGIAQLLSAYGVKDLIGADLRQEALRRFEVRGGRPAALETLLAEADVVIATTGRRELISPDSVRPGQIVFALSNPEPEITPEAALAAGAALAADGRLVNNALAFPGIFRGALTARSRTITDEMKLAAAHAIARYAEPGELVPGLLHTDVHMAVAEAVEEAANAASEDVEP